MTSREEIRTEPRPDCVVCGSPGEPLYRDMPSALFDTPGRWNFSRCSRPECGLIWMNPAPVEADIYKAYENYFTHGGGENPGSGIRDTLYAFYRAVNFPGWWVTGIVREKRQRSLMFLESVSPGKLLDVGCGDGTFLQLMKSRGWSVDGIDFDAKGIETARRRYGLNLRHGDLRSAEIPADQFDAVTMSHVIEHLKDPIGMLTEIRRIMKSGGRLVVTTPNVESMGHQKFGQCWFGLDAPRHLNLFSAAALSQVAKRAGFNSIEVRSSAASADVFFGGSFTLQEKRGHRMGHQPTPNVLRTLKAAWWQYREHFALGQNPNCGEELVIVCSQLH